jgi:hypothetical protein
MRTLHMGIGALARRGGGGDALDYAGLAVGAGCGEPRQCVAVCAGAAACMGALQGSEVRNQGSEDCG